MSQDEMVFDEVRYREPLRARRPDRDKRWACLAYEIPGPSDLPVFLDRASADAIERHALRDTSVELGGILLGKECVDDQTGTPFVWVTKSLEAKHYENTQASFTYTHDSWEEITRERDKLHPDLDIVGWYHTHPDFGVFLSSHDLFIHRNFFAQPLQVAYVVDPIRQTRGFFRWKSGEMEQTGGFYLTADRAERAALTRLVNDLENIPNADASGGSGGLSPRLEAELIAMLTRPSSSHLGMTSADRAQTALVFSMLGAMFGVIALAALLWLNTLSGQVKEQAAVLKELNETVRESSDRQRIALEGAVGDTGISSPQAFLDRYGRAARDRDDARTQLENQTTANNLLAAKVRQLNEDNSKLDAQNKVASQFEKDAKEASTLRTSLNELKETSERQARQIAEYEGLFDTPGGKKAAILAESNARVWYTAVAGWAVSALLGLALIGSYASRKPSLDEPPGGPIDGHPPVQIR